MDQDTKSPQLEPDGYISNQEDTDFEFYESPRPSARKGRGTLLVNTIEESTSLEDEGEEVVDLPSDPEFAIVHRPETRKLLQKNQTSYLGSPTTPKKQLQEETWSEKLKYLVPYYIPIIKWLPNYNVKECLLYDLVAGIGIASMLIPQCLAYSTLAQVPPNIGLYTAWVPLIIYGIFGTCRQMSIGPDALVSLLIGLEMSKMPELESTADFVAMAHCLSFMVGVVLFVCGIFRFGFLENILSGPLLSGFINAVALIIILDQADTFLGIPIPPSDKEGSYGVYKLPYLFHHLKESHWPTIVFFIGTVSILVVFRTAKAYTKSGHLQWKWVRHINYIPETLIVVILGTVVSSQLSLARQGIAVVGKFDSDFLPPILPPLNKLTAESISSILLISTVGFVESIAVCKSQMKNEPLSPNRELVAYGMLNMAGSIFNSYPTFGSLPRSNISASLGAKTQLFGIIASAFVLIAMFVVSIFESLPRAVMSAIITVAACGLFEYHEILFMIKIKSWREVIISVFIFGLTLAIGVDYGILLALLVSTVLVIQHTSMPHISLLGQDENKEFHELTVHPGLKTVPGILVVRIEEGLYFANMQYIEKILYRLETQGDVKAHPGQEQDSKRRHIIIQGRYIASMDGSAVLAFIELMKEYDVCGVSSPSKILQARGTFVCFSRLRKSITKKFLDANMGGLTDQRIFISIPEAISYIQNNKIARRMPIQSSL